MHRLDDPPPMTPETQEEKAARRELLLKAAAALPPRNVVLDAEESEVYRAATTDEERSVALQIIARVRAKKARDQLELQARLNSPNAKQAAINRKVKRREAKASRRKNRAR